MRIKRLIASAVASTALLVGGLAAPAVTSANAAVGSLESYDTTVGGDPATVYYRVPDTGQTFPFALMLQGANVDKQYYAKFAKLVSSFGFIVIVPNHASAFPPGLYPVEQQITATAAWSVAENARADSPIKGFIDTSKMGVLGHSYGGAAGLYAAEGSCQPPFCFGPPVYTPPAALKGAALYGTNTVQGPAADPVDVKIPTALINGTQDTISTSAEAQATFDAMTGAKRALITFTGPNHYGIADVNNPPGAVADPGVPSISQNLSYSDIAQWSARWLQASWGDPNGTAFVYGYGDALDSRVTVQNAG